MYKYMYLSSKLILLFSSCSSLCQDEPQVLQKPIELEIDGTTNKKGRSLGNITVSVVFRPVDSVAKAGTLYCMYMYVCMYVYTVQWKHVTGWMEVDNMFSLQNFSYAAELPRSNVGLPQGVDLSVPSPTTGGSGTLRRGSKQAVS